MTQDTLAPKDSRQAGPERFNSVQPELGSGTGWDRSDLAQLLHLHPGPDGALYSQHSQANAQGAVFGGQLIGQALMAARHGLGDSPPAHSLQVNFLAAGRPAEAMRYEVRPLMRGRSFSVQQILGMQGERMVISATASFHKPEAGPMHQLDAPGGLADPDSLPTMGEVVARNAHRIPAAARRYLGASPMLDMRPLDAEGFLFRRDPEARFRYWLKLKRPLPADAGLQQAALGYLSDYWFPMTGTTPLLEHKIGSGLYVASLNHTLWFHQPARLDEWLLVDAHSPFCGNARGLSMGRIYRRDGALLASLAQEGLFRGWVERDGGFAAPGLPDAPLHNDITYLKETRS